jgi:hypothetical protein
MAVEIRVTVDPVKQRQSSPGTREENLCFKTADRALGVHGFVMPGTIVYLRDIIGGSICEILHNLPWAINEIK